MSVGWYAIPNDATHAAVITINFTDGGEPEQQMLHFGSFDECDRVARELPATSYCGGRPVKDACVSVYSLHPLCGECGSRHDGPCK